MKIPSILKCKLSPINTVNEPITSGNVFDVFERDCSVQRRHQKILEEAPSALDQSRSAEIREKARVAARAVNYWNAGTVEFLMDKRTGEFYFMEMNTRLQVEHPVSEMVSGLDLVELQLRVANGENLQPLMENIVSPKGHAIEARICAEDWMNGFLPQFGKISRFSLNDRPVVDLREKLADYNFERISEQGGRGQRTGTFRADLGFGEGSEVSQFYDSMIGKVIVWGETREESLKKLEETLEKFKLMGLETNLPFIRGVLKQPKFRDYTYSLDFFSEVQEHVIRTQGQNPFNQPEIVAAAASALLKLGNVGLGTFRLNQKLKKYLRLECDRAFGKSESKIEVELEIEEMDRDARVFHLKIFDVATKSLNRELDFMVSRVSVEVGRGQEAFDIRIRSSESGFEQFKVQLDSVDGKYFVYCEGQFWRVDDKTLRESVSVQERPQNKEFVICPMSGIVSKLLVSAGDVLKKGNPVLSVEAMKMEHKIFAGFDLEVLEVNCKEGGFVELGDPIVKIREISN